MEFRVSNVNQALADACHYLRTSGVEETSRNGRVIVAPEPVMTTYLLPFQRVLFSPKRDANPFFHVMEALWMLAGRNDIAFPTLFNSKFVAFSDDGKTQWGAYGYRWRKWFNYDQLRTMVEELKMNPNSRRIVLSMWNPATVERDVETESGLDTIRYEPDLNKAMRGGKDVPCNTHAYLDLRDGSLNMTVCCRSNDMLWGAYGANAVHFSFLQEYLAAWLRVRVGAYRQFSNNFHFYPDTFVKTGEDWKLYLFELATDAQRANRYDLYDLVHVPLVNPQSSIEAWDGDLWEFLRNPETPENVRHPWFLKVAYPMYRTWMARKRKDYAEAWEWVARIEATDWARAAEEWMERRRDVENAAPKVT